MPSTIFASDEVRIGQPVNGRVLDYCQNGVFWVVLFNTTGSGDLRFFYSTDLGVNWNEAVESRLIDNSSAATLFIDKDDYAHIVYTNDDAVIRPQYRIGTPDASRTSWTWSAPLLLPVGSSSSAGGGMDVVAHREGSVWVAHCLSDQHDGSNFANVTYTIIDIDALHVPTTRSSTIIHTFGTVGGSYQASMDFRHTEADPKSVQSSTPSVYVCYFDSSITTGALFYKKIAYSAGVWTPGTERTLDANAQLAGNHQSNLVYDGTRIMVTGVRNATNTVVRVAERDEADTTTTARDPTALADGLVGRLDIGVGKNGDVWLYARAATSQDSKKIRFNRGSVTWDAAWTVIEADTAAGSPGVSMFRGISDQSQALGVVYGLSSASPDQNRYDAIFSDHRAEATLQGVGSMSPDPSLGIAAEASLQAVATVSPLGNVGHGPTALLQGVATLEGKGLLTPTQDYTVYDAFLDGLGLFGPQGLIYYENEQTQKTTVSQQLRPARTDTGDQPTEVRPESGEVFSQQDFSHGAGQLYAHHEGRDVKKFLWAEGFDVDIDTVGQPATLVHQNAVAQSLSSTTAGDIIVFNDTPFVIDGTTIKKFIGPLPGSWTDDGPHAGETATTPQDMVSSGEYLYAALGANGIHRRNTAGTWTHWSAVQATRVAWVKNRIMATNGPSIYEVLEPGGAAPTPIETLPAGWTFESIFEVSGFVYATAVNRTSELSRIHAYKLNAGGTALEKRSETPFPRDQLIVAGSGYLDNVLLGGGIKTSAGGFDPVVYQAGVADQDTGALTYAKVAEGEGAGGVDLSVKAFEARGEDVVFGWSLGSGFTFGARDGLALLKLKVGGFFPYLKTATAGESRAVEAVTLWQGQLLFTLKGKGVFYQDTTKLVAEAYLVSSVADYQTTARKVWDLAQVSHAPLPANTTVKLDITTRNPSDGQWDLAITSDVDDAEIAETRFDDLATRLLAVRLRSTSNAGQTAAPSGLGFLVRSNLLPDTPEWNLTRYLRLMKRDVKDNGGEEVYLGNVQTTLKQIQSLAYRIVNLYEPGVKWTVRVDRVADMTPFLPRYWEKAGEERQDVVILQLSMSGTRD